MRIFLSWLLLISGCTVFSQELAATETVPKQKVDSLYREDQFYFGITYNILRNKPADVSQSKFSSGLSAGFLRDMPINKERTLAIAAGLGFSYTNFNQNLAITSAGENQVYSYIDSKTKYDKNKFSLLSIDLPLEFRWRTSTYESHKFWRIYSGFKLSYLIYDRSIFSGADGNIILKGNSDFNKIQYGAYVSAGYNTINLYAYYGLNSIFKSVVVNNESVKVKALNIGIVFYIL